MSLSKPRNLRLEIPETTVELPEDLPSEDQRKAFVKQFDDEITESDILEIKLGTQSYPFSKTHVARYPKLLDPNFRFLLPPYEPILALIYGYPPESIPEDLINDPSEKTKLLYACEFLGIRLPDSFILHLSKKLSADLRECVKYIKKKVGRKGKNTCRLLKNKDIKAFVLEKRAVFRDAGSAMDPQEILEKLETDDNGERSFLDQLVVDDWRTDNLISGFINAFIEKFLKTAR
jgi:hypothetical protein